MRKMVTQMSRLIDADKLKEAIEEEKDDNDYMCRLCLESIKEIIDEHPTVFDVDKVAEKLENYFNTTENKDMRLAYHHAIEIVKGGGVE